VEAIELPGNQKGPKQLTGSNEQIAGTQEKAGPAKDPQESKWSAFDKVYTAAEENGTGQVSRNTNGEKSQKQARSHSTIQATERDEKAHNNSQEQCE